MRWQRCAWVKKFATFFYSKLVEPPPLCFAYMISLYLSIPVSFWKKNVLILLVLYICHAIFMFIFPCINRVEWGKNNNPSIHTILPYLYMCNYIYIWCNVHKKLEDDETTICLCEKNYWAVFCFWKIIIVSPYNITCGRFSSCMKWV